MHVDLLELPYFEGVSMDALVSLVDRMKPCQFEAKSLIMPEGGDPMPLFIATTGRVMIAKKGPDGKDRNLADLDSPTLFGEIELFCQLPAVCSAYALTHVEAFTLDRETFDELYKSGHPGVLAFTFNVARVASHRLAIADEMLARVLEDEDLCALRRTVWAKMSRQDDPDWLKTTGAFRRPK